MSQMILHFYIWAFSFSLYAITGSYWSLFYVHLNRWMLFITEHRFSILDRVYLVRAVILLEPISEILVLLWFRWKMIRRHLLSRRGRVQSIDSKFGKLLQPAIVVFRNGNHWWVVMTDSFCKNGRAHITELRKVSWKYFNSLIGGFDGVTGGFQELINILSMTIQSWQCIIVNLSFQ